MSSTIEISNEAKNVWDRWKKATNKTSIELMDAIVDSAIRHKQRELYLSLPRPDKTNKPLINIRIHKNYRKINGTL